MFHHDEPKLISSGMMDESLFLEKSCFTEVIFHLKCDGYFFPIFLIDILIFLDYFFD